MSLPASEHVFVSSPFLKANFAGDGIRGGQLLREAESLPAGLHDVR